MELSVKFQEFRAATEVEMRSVVEQGISRQYGELRAMLAYHLGWEGAGAGVEAQGKRIRPILTMLCAESAGGDWRRAVPAAAAVELLHNFSLIHDDIQDESPLRHGRPTVWSQWGIAQAINAGDVMFTLAFQALRRLSESVSKEIAFEAHGLLENTCLRLTEGQYLDMAYEKKRELPLEDYWPMITGKTSALLGCCAELGALSAGVNEHTRVAYREYGLSLGLAFQTLDDWLGIWGDSGATGKSVESDLVSGKKTLPVVYALAAGGTFRERWLRGPISGVEVPAVVKMLDECGAGDYTLRKAQELTEQAQAALHLAAGEERGHALRALTAQLLKRDK